MEVTNHLLPGMILQVPFAGRVATLSLGVLCMVAGWSLHLDVVLTSFQTSFQTTSALVLIISCVDHITQNVLEMFLPRFTNEIWCFGQTGYSPIPLFTLPNKSCYIYIIIHIIYLLTSFQTSFPLNYILQGTWILRFRCGAASYLFIKKPVGRSHLNLLLGGYEPSSYELHICIYIYELYMSYMDYEQIICESNMKYM